MWRRTAVWLLICGGAALAVIALARPDLLAGGRGPRALYLVLLLAYLGASAWTGFRLSPGRILLNAVIWLAIVVALVGGYQLWLAWR